MEVVNAIGRRKSAVARVYLSEGTGKITINKKDITEYFPSAILQYVVKQPLQALEAAEKYDIIYPGNVYTDENGHTKATHLLFCGMPSELMFVFWLVTFTTTGCSFVGFAFDVSVFTSAPQRGHDFAFLFSIFAPHCLQT